MKKFQKIVPGLAAVILVASNGVTGETRQGEDDKSRDLKIAISNNYVNKSSGLISIDYSVGFNVVLENVSKHPIKIWNGLENSGYLNLSFRILDSDGNVSIAKRVPFLGSETDMSLILDSGDCYIIAVKPMSSEWTGFPQRRFLTIRAIYECESVKQDPLGWVGKIESREKKYEIFNLSPREVTTDSRETTNPAAPPLPPAAPKKP